MKDTDLIKQKVEEYGIKILRLKQLGTELTSLDTEGFESEVRSIKSKIKDLNRVEEVERVFSELKRKIEAKEKIKSLKSIVESKKRILFIPNAEELIEKAESTLKIGNYDDAVKWAKEAECIAKETDRKYRDAWHQIRSAESAIEKVRDFGCDTLEVEELLNKTKLETEKGNYGEAISDASRSEEVVKEIKEKAKPEIEVDLSKKEFRVGVWEDVSLKISNDGNAHAKEVEIEFSDEVKVKGLGIMERLDVGEEIDLEVSFKSIDAGKRVPLEISTRFKDLDGGRYNEMGKVYINVGRITKEEVKEYEIPTEKKKIALTIERAIYDPCKRDFIERALPRMKDWIERHDPGAYWFAMSIQNNTDKTIEEWGVELGFSSALKTEEAKIEGIEIEIPHEAHLGLFNISVPKEYGIVIPKGGAQRVYFKLRAEKPKTTYEISGVFKSTITGDVPIRTKEFKYLCDAVSLRGAILEHPETALEYVETQVNRYSYSPAEVSAIVKGVDIVSGICRMCESRYPKRADVRSEVENLKGYLENVEDTLGRSYKDFEMLVREMDAVLFEATVPEDYAEKIKRKCLVFPDDLLAKLQKQGIERGD